MGGQIQDKVVGFAVAQPNHSLLVALQLRQAAATCLDPTVMSGESCKPGFDIIGERIFGSNVADKRRSKCPSYLAIRQAAKIMCGHTETRVLYPTTQPQLTKLNSNLMGDYPVHTSLLFREIDVRKPLLATSGCEASWSLLQGRWSIGKGGLMALQPPRSVIA